MKTDNITPIPPIDYAGIALVLAEFNNLYKANCIKRELLDECFRALFTPQIIIPKK